MEEALKSWEVQLGKPKMDLSLDRQNLGLRPYLEGIGLDVRDVTEITGDKDTSRSIYDGIIVEYLKKHPELLLITKDTDLAVRCETHNLSGQLMYIDESETIAKEVFH